MILIADSGSTKTDWVLADGKADSRYKTGGFNPYFIGTEAICKTLGADLLPQIGTGIVKKVHFYGAGCSTAENVEIVRSALSRLFPQAEVRVGHDMLAAARALLGNQRGFAAIIGTGSNTCLYNGREIECNIDSLGYLLGDEGSGSYIGKKIVRDFMRGYLPPALESKFVAAYGLKNNEIFDSLYNKEAPNRFLASFCKFAHQNKDHVYIQKLLRQSFLDFFDNLVSRYPGYRNYTFNCVGSVGFIFRDHLEQVAELHRMKVGKLIASPIDELVNYHRVRE